MTGTFDLKIDLVEKETERAFLVIIDGEKYWLPKSQIRGGEDKLEEKAEDVEVTVNSWWAEQEGLGE